MNNYERDELELHNEDPETFFKELEEAVARKKKERRNAILFILGMIVLALLINDII